MATIRQYQETHFQLGCDPEFFFMRDGKVVGSEKILPPGGLTDGYNKVIIDGVQAEINLYSHPTCRQEFASCLRNTILMLRGHLSKHPGVSVCWDPLVEVDEKELLSLDPANQKFGCKASANVNPFVENIVSKLDPKKYLYRAAGGHIHLGLGKIDKETAERIVQVMDILLGNTCVLIDRHPGNVERRKVYGRAGEYRIPPHGIEYRTLSNFWLRNYALMSFVMRMARVSAAVVFASTKQSWGSSSLEGGPLEASLLALVDMAKIHQAINTNDKDLAMENFLAIKPWILTSSFYGFGFPIYQTEGSFKDFLYFVEMVQTKGMEHCFPLDPLTSWVNENRNYGWENFLCNVASQRANAEATAKKKVA